MKDTLQTAFLTVIGLVIAAVFIIWVYGAVHTAMDNGDQALDKANVITQAAIEGDITQYDGKVIKGSGVISAIKNFESQDTVLNVVVNNGNGTTEYCYQSDLSTKIKVEDTSTADGIRVFANKADLSTYINPSASFTGLVTRDDATGTIITLTFTKVKS